MGRTSGNLCQKVGDLCPGAAGRCVSALWFCGDLCCTFSNLCTTCGLCGTFLLPRPRFLTSVHLSLMGNEGTLLYRRAGLLHQRIHARRTTGLLFFIGRRVSGATIRLYMRIVVRPICSEMRILPCRRALCQRFVTNGAQGTTGRLLVLQNELFDRRPCRTWLLRRCFPRGLSIFLLQLILNHVFRRPNRYFHPFFHFGRPIAPIASVGKRATAYGRRCRRYRRRVRLYLLPFRHRGRINLQGHLLQLILAPSDALRHDGDVNCEVVVTHRIRRVGHAIAYVVCRYPVCHRRVLFHRGPIPTLTAFPLLVRVMFHQVGRPFFRRRFRFRRVSRARLRQISSVLLRAAGDDCYAKEFVGEMDLRLNVIARVVRCLANVSYLRYRFCTTLRMVKYEVVLIRPRNGSRERRTSNSYIRDCNNARDFCHFLVVFPSVRVPMYLVGRRVDRSSHILRHLNRDCTTIGNDCAPFILFRPVPMPNFRLVKGRVLHHIITRSMVVKDERCRKVFHRQIIPFVIRVDVRPSVRRPLLVQGLQ